MPGEGGVENCPADHTSFRRVAGSRLFLDAEGIAVGDAHVRSAYAPWLQFAAQLSPPARRAEMKIVCKAQKPRTGAWGIYDERFCEGW